MSTGAKEVSATTPNLVHEEVVAPDSVHTAAPTRVIAIAVDASPYAEFAFKWAVDNIVRPETDQIVLLNVRPFASLPAVHQLYVDFSGEFSKIDEANKKASHDLLRKFADELPVNKYNVRGVALRGDPRDEIAYKVEDVNADMLVIGSRGLGAVKRTIMGSVSDFLVHNLKVPVIIPRSKTEKSA